MQLGEGLVQRGVITEAELRFAMHMQEALRSQGQPAEKTRLGNILVGLTFVSAAELAAALSEGAGGVPLDIPAHACQQCKAVPEGVAGSVLHVTSLGPLTDTERGLLVRAARGQGVRVDTVEERVAADSRELLMRLRDLAVDPSQLDSLLHTLDADPESAGVSDLMLAVLHDATQARASDIYLSAMSRGGVLSYRVDGKRKTRAWMTAAAGRSLAARIKHAGSMDTGMTYRPQDGALSFMYHGREAWARIATQPVKNDGETLTLRILDPGRLRTLKNAMGPHTAVVEGLRNLVLNEAPGLVLVSGATGHGKSNTLAALVRDYVRATDLETRVLSIEDPIEQDIAVDGVIEQTQVNTDVSGMGFADLVRSALRQSPDFIVVGEIRDIPTSEATLRAAETGHRSAASIHAGSATQTISRLLSFVPAETRQAGIWSLAMNLGGVLHQELVPKLCSCCETVKAGPNRLGLDENAEVKRPVGCDLCDGTGYLDRVVMVEFLAFSRASKPGLQRLLAEGRTPSEAISLPGVTYYSRQDAAVSAAKAGCISLADAERIAAE